MQRCLSIPALLLAGACQPGRAVASESGRVERRLAAMGTWLEVSVLAADRQRALEASEAAVRAIEAAESRLSTWSQDSELARLNRAPVGAQVELSPALAADLRRARHFWSETSGAFDPGLGALVAAWGLRSGGRRPAPDELAAARAAGGFAAFTLDGTHAVRRNALAAVEEGGFGKGIGLDDALAALRAAGVQQGVLDLGGQLALLGPASVTTALADPADRARPVLELTFPAGSLSTSGNSERGIVVEGAARAHILDPRTGEPAEDFGSLTVWAPDATAADCLSTGLFVLGPAGAFRWLAGRHGLDPGLEIVALVREPERLVALASAGWRGRARALVPDLELRFVPRDAVPSLETSIPVLSSR